MVIYDDLSGDTLKLDVIMAEIFRRVQQGAATFEQLAQHLSNVLDVEIDLRLERLVEIALERFEASGLLISAAAPSPDGGKA
jgi:PqqD family protein of HPr-rel-A system